VIIEDDEIIRKGYEFLINNNHGYIVVAAYSSFDEAYKKIVDNCPDVILLILNCPEQMGIEAIPS